MRFASKSRCTSPPGGALIAAMLVVVLQGAALYSRATAQSAAPAATEGAASSEAPSEAPAAKPALPSETTISAAPEAGAPGDEEETAIVRLTEEGPDVPWDALEIGDFSLVDHLGQPVTRDSLKRKPWIANFIFTRCAVECPLLLRNTFTFHQEMKDFDFRIVTITVDPKYDTVDVMNRQSQVFQVDPDRWKFVTGEPDKVLELIRKGFKQAAWENVGTRKQPGMEFTHSLNMIHIDAQGRIIGKYDGRAETDLAVLRRVLRGEMETPRKYRPVAVTTAPPAAVPGGGDAAAGNGPPPGQLPPWVERLPATNAMLNVLATVLLLGGLSAIRTRNVRLHRKLMLFAFAVSIAFLGSYLVYHFALQHYTGEPGRRYAGPAALRAVYYIILITHVVLAAITPVGALAALYFAAKQQWTRHRAVARVTFPVWLYVSVTGVVIYLMLYHLPAGG